MMEVMKPGNSNSNLGRNASELADYIHVQEDEDAEANVEDHFASQPTMNDVESRGLIIQWKNCMNGRISLLPKAYKFPSMPLPNFIRMWYCGDKPKNIPPYKMLRHADLTGLKSYKQKITNMKKLIFHVERAACDLLFRPELIKRQWTVNDTLVLYHAVKPYFRFEVIIGAKRKRRFETISWKTYYNVLCKRKGLLVGEVI